MEEIKQYALSDEDLYKLLGKELSIITYPQLEEFVDIDQIFDRKGRCMILFLNQSPTEGHWCCLIRKPDSIEFFDPYGDDPEQVRKDTPKPLRQQLEMDRPLLFNLLKKKGIPVYFNSFQFQKNGYNIATCGRHSAVRLFYAPYSLDKYKEIIDSSKMTPDTFVSALTFTKLGK